MRDLVQAIADRLGNEYDYDIYTDELEQGFEDPCFFIEVISSRRSWINKTRYKMQVTVAIYYFPTENGKKNNQMLAVADDLYFLMDVFQGKYRKYRGVDMNHSVHEDFLKFNLNVNYHVLVGSDEANMEVLFHNTATKTE